MTIFEHFKQVAGLVFRAEDLLAGSRILLDAEAKALLSLNLKDLRALKWASDKQLHIGIICSESARKTLHAKLDEYGITYCWIDEESNADRTTFTEWSKKHQLTPSQLAFIAGDLIDLPYLDQVHTPCCSSDAAEEIKQRSLYISSSPSGNGAIRDILEKILKLQNKWNEIGA